MKATELMINDWVEDDLGDFTKVFSINNMSVILQAGVNTRAACYEFIDPISLNEDILNANGFFHFVDEEDSFIEAWRMDVVGYEIDLIPSINYDRFTASIKRGPDKHISVPVRYVHELQHVLRLVGLDNMADNFKVK